ncbi:MAG: ABC transporter permease [Candidatus Methanoperedens sp.]|nr:ABC transporter permease [Candidatus Methanoperedens sp.]
MLSDLKVSLFLAYKSITKGNKGTLILTIFILSLVFVNLMFIASIFLGLTDTMGNQVIDTLYGNIVIEPKKDEKYINDVYSLEQKIRSIPGIEGVLAQYITGATLSYKDKSGSWSVRSVNPDDAMTVTITHNFMIDGEYLSKLDTSEIILGKEIPGGYGGDQEQLSLGGVRVGDSIDVLFNNGVKKSYRVKGVFDVTFTQANNIAYISQREMESVFGLEDKASQILIKTKDRGNEDRYVKQLSELGIKENIKPWTAYAASIKNITRSFDMISVLISAIGLFVASVTIFIIIYVSTISKRRQIGILRAVGIKESVVIYSYIFQAMFIAICGTIIGFFIMFFVLRPWFIGHPLKFPIGFVSLLILPENILINAISLIAVALTAGFVPSWIAVRQTIMDAMWGD